MAQERIAVLGAGFAGCFTAAALAGAGHEVVLLERDRLPDEPRPRRGVPQGAQPHVLLARALTEADRLLPGVLDRLRAAGARPMDSGRLPWLSEWGWLVDGREIDTLSLTRPLLEHVVRGAVLELTRVSLLEGAEVHHLSRDAGEWIVRGEGFPDVRADVVVDATGRSSRLPAWLRSTGVAPPLETVIDAQVGYATRTYLGPRNGIEGVVFQLNRHTLTGGAALPVEHDRWLVAVVGCGNRRPPRDIAGFEAALGGLGDPAIADLARSLEPVGDVAVHRQTANRRLRYERLRDLPPGLLVVGDAMCCFNPVYGQGITVAAVQAGVLRRLAPEISGRVPLGGVQRQLARVTELPWIVAAGADAQFPTSNRPPSPMQRLGGAWGHRLTRASAYGDRTAVDAVRTAYNLIVPPTALIRPRVVVAGLRPRSGPPTPRPAALTAPLAH